MLDPLKDMVAWRTIENFPDNDWPIAQVNNFISLAQNIFLSFKVYRGNALSLERSDTIHFFPASSLLKTFVLRSWMFWTFKRWTFIFSCNISSHTPLQTFAVSNGKNVALNSLDSIYLWHHSTIGTEQLHGPRESIQRDAQKWLSISNNAVIRRSLSLDIYVANELQIHQHIHKQKVNVQHCHTTSACSTILFDAKSLLCCF